MNYLAFATNFKNETPYLCEWLEFHRLVGVDHFYLYDQDCTPETSALLLPYERSGVVTRHPWTQLNGSRYDGPTRFYQRNKNHLAFAHCAATYRNQVTWLMKIDVDEFLVPPDGWTLPEWLSGYAPDKNRGIRLARFNFGDCGLSRRPPGLVTESYTRREAIPSNHKDMASAGFLSDNRHCGSAHHWHYRWLRLGRFVRADWRTEARIFHYYTKSLEEYRQRQNVSRGRGLTEEAFLARNRLANAVEDLTMLTYLPSLRLRLQATAPPAHV